MTNPVGLSPYAALLCLALSSPASAAQPAVVATAPTPAASDVPTFAAADGCRADLKAFDARMEKDGYWLSGGGNGFGYRWARPGSACTAKAPIRTALVPCASNTKEFGQATRCACSSRPPTSWRGMAGNRTARTFLQRHGDKDAQLRSGQLLGVEVRSANDTALGSVDDLVMNPKTNEIAYLVVARGGIFGLDESHVPVPWKDFKASTPAKTA